MEHIKEIKNVCILVNSFDGYSDIWNNFFKFFNKNWFDCELPVYLSNNVMEYGNEKLKNLKVINTGNETNWGLRLKYALSQIEEDYIILFLEDYFIDKNVDNDKINDIIIMFQNSDYDYLRLYNFPKAKKKPLNDIVDLPIYTGYGVNLQLALWKKDKLLEMLNEPCSAWEFEAKQKFQSKFKTDGKYKTCNYNVISYLNGVLQGKYFPPTLKKLKKLGVEIGDREVLSYNKVLNYRAKRLLMNIVPYRIKVKVKKILTKLRFKFVTKD